MFIAGRRINISRLGDIFTASAWSGYLLRSRGNWSALLSLLEYRCKKDSSPVAFRCGQDVTDEERQVGDDAFREPPLICKWSEDIHRSYCADKQSNDLADRLLPEGGDS